jgi:hypothetical protein
MSDFLDESYQPQQAKRPVFLTVLCILTFVSCGLTFFSAIYGILTAGVQQRMFSMMNRMPQNDEMPEIADRMMLAMNKAQGWLLFGHYLSLGNVLFCLFGALLMWRLKKVGFYIYTFGQLLPLVTLFGMVSVFQNVPIMGTAMLIGSIFTVVFSAAFVVMYGLNLKHMR